MMTHKLVPGFSAGEGFVLMRIASQPSAATLRSPERRPYVVETKV